MCNAKPGRRCAGPDTQKPIATNAKKLEELKKAYSAETDPDKRSMLRELVIEQNDKFKDSKVTYYASAKAQKDFPAALQTVRELSGPRATYDDVEETLFIAGGQLNELQTKADEMRKTGATQVEVARYFNQGGIIIETDKMRDKITAEPNDTPAPDDGTFDAPARKLKALQIATGVMWRDCAEVVGADMKKNSGEYTSTDGSKLSVKKRPTGRFAVTNEFIVKADSPEDAASKAEGSYDPRGVPVSVELEPVAGKTGEYRAKASYLYRGGENLIDALIFQNKIYRGHDFY
jgi:hypothetical protein